MDKCVFNLQILLTFSEDQSHYKSVIGLLLGKEEENVLTVEHVVPLLENNQGEKLEEEYVKRSIALYQQIHKDEKFIGWYVNDREKVDIGQFCSLLPLLFSSNILIIRVEATDITSLFISNSLDQMEKIPYETELSPNENIIIRHLFDDAIHSKDIPSDSTFKSIEFNLSITTKSNLSWKKELIDSLIGSSSNIAFCDIMDEKKRRRLKEMNSINQYKNNSDDIVKNLLEMKKKRIMENVHNRI
ncbi:hypothetical protein SNEBB_000890 [Seison nebaliae]|nr:hypothetical protein SNEBB_000890 [Seison nebaliae]